MNVVLYGATGNSGRRILNELVARGHSVTAVARDTSKVSADIPSRQDDLSSVDQIAAITANAEAVISAYNPSQNDTDALISVTERQIAAVQQNGAKARLIIVGGAGLLEVAPGVSLIDSGHLPAAYLPIAVSHQKAFQVLKSSGINWTYFSPAAFFEPGERTGKFRLGHTELISDANHQSRISMEDYAIALVDELEKPARERDQFSIGY
jgi:putative NADH-flavin reductase